MKPGDLVRINSDWSTYYSISTLGETVILKRGDVLLYTQDVFNDTNEYRWDRVIPAGNRLVYHLVLFGGKLLHVSPNVLEKVET